MFFKNLCMVTLLATISFSSAANANCIDSYNQYLADENAIPFGREIGSGLVGSGMIGFGAAISSTTPAVLGAASLASYFTMKVDRIKKMKDVTNILDTIYDAESGLNTRLTKKFVADVKMVADNSNLDDEVILDKLVHLAENTSLYCSKDELMSMSEVVETVSLNL